jgi:hypothetical protein
MTMPDPSSDHPALARRVILLKEDHRGLLVQVPQSDAPPVIYGRLPRFPMTLAHWLAALGDRFRGNYGGSLGVFLLLDVLHRRWSHLIPTQRCCAEATPVWQPTESDIEIVPAHHRVAGSFQALTAPTLAGALELAPTFDGLHLLQVYGSRRRRKQPHMLAALRIGGQTSLGDPHALFSDDLEETLRQHAERLR